MSHTLTEKQIKYFVSDVQKWCQFFSIADYHVRVGEESDEYAAGSCWADAQNRVAVISINPEWDDKPTKKDLSRIAFHEVCELMFMEFSTLAETRFLTQASLDIAKHRIIRTLENSVWKQNN